MTSSAITNLSEKSIQTQFEDKFIAARSNIEEKIMISEFIIFVLFVAVVGIFFYIGCAELLIAVGALSGMTPLLSFLKVLDVIFIIIILGLTCYAATRPARLRNEIIKLLQERDAVLSYESWFNKNTLPKDHRFDGRLLEYSALKLAHERWYSKQSQPDVSRTFFIKVTTRNGFQNESMVEVGLYQKGDGLVKREALFVFRKQQSNRYEFVREDLNNVQCVVENVQFEVEDSVEYSVEDSFGQPTEPDEFSVE